MTSRETGKVVTTFIISITSSITRNEEGKWNKMILICIEQIWDMLRVAGWISLHLHFLIQSTATWDATLSLLIRSYCISIVNIDIINFHFIPPLRCPILPPQMSADRYCLLLWRELIMHEEQRATSADIFYYIQMQSKIRDNRSLWEKYSKNLTWTGSWFHLSSVCTS